MRSGELSSRAARDRQTEKTGQAVACPQAALISLVERERKRLGFDLHDGPAQYMSAALLQIRVLELADSTDIPTALAELRQTISLALAETYELIGELGGRRGDDEDLTARIEALAEDLRVRANVEVVLDLAGDPASISDSQRIAIYRIVQEALANVRRHARASHVFVGVRFDADAITCTVRDDGCGFDPDAQRSSGRREPFGLRGMCERARLLDGELTLHSRPGRGTCVIARIPAWQG